MQALLGRQTIEIAVCDSVMCLLQQRRWNEFHFSFRRETNSIMVSPNIISSRRNGLPRSQTENRGYKAHLASLKTHYTCWPRLGPKNIETLRKGKVLDSLHMIAIWPTFLSGCAHVRICMCVFVSGWVRRERGREKRETIGCLKFQVLTQLLMTYVAMVISSRKMERKWFPLSNDVFETTGGMNLYWIYESE